MFCRGRPMCRPVAGPVRRRFRADTQVRPYAGWKVFRTNGNWRRTEVFPSGAGRSPPPTGGAEQADASRTAGCAWGVASASQIPRRNLGRRGVVTPPYGRNAGGAQQRADVVIGPYAPRGGEGRHAGASCPTGGYGEPPRLPWVVAHSGVSATRSRGMGRNRRKDHPQRGQQPQTIPQSACG